MHGRRRHIQAGQGLKVGPTLTLTFFVDFLTPLKVTFFAALPVFVDFLSADLTGAFAFDGEDVLVVFALAAAVVAMAFFFSLAAAASPVSVRK